MARRVILTACIVIQVQIIWLLPTTIIGIPVSRFCIFLKIFRNHRFSQPQKERVGNTILSGQRKQPTATKNCRENLAGLRGYLASCSFLPLPPVHLLRQGLFQGHFSSQSTPLKVGWLATLLGATDLGLLVHLKLWGSSLDRQHYIPYHFWYHLVERQQL